jgi:hypothetical protein
MIGSPMKMFPDGWKSAGAVTLRDASRLVSPGLLASFSTSVTWMRSGPSRARRHAIAVGRENSVWIIGRTFQRRHFDVLWETACNVPDAVDLELG